MTEALLTLARINLATAVAVGLVLLLRRPVRRLFGPRIAYGLWSLVPLAAAAMLLPARVMTISEPALAATGRASAATLHSVAIAPHLSPAFDLPALLGGLWLAGALAALAGLIWRQARFAHAARAGYAGPAVIGVLRPRVVTPSDFAARYTPREQQVILAHEQAHIARQDPRINALVALARCVNWFNPLAHVLAYYLRIDQELACDAQVVARHPTTRRSYAEAMLKTQLAVRPLPLGCYWPAQSAHPLAERIALLSRQAPGPIARAVGGGLVAALAFGGGWSAWAARPAEVVMVASAAPAGSPKPFAPLRANRTNAALPVASPRSLEAEPISAVAEEAQTPAGTPLPLSQISATAPEPPEGCGEDGPFSADHRRLLPPGFFGPSRKIPAIAGWSSVEPGSAVRVYATMTDPDGVPLITDLTAFGSQSYYRLGCIRRGPSHYKLFTRVVQHGERLVVTAGLNQSFRPMSSASVELSSGETSAVTLPNGLRVTVTATTRPETPEEVAEGRRNQAGRLFVNVIRAPMDT